MLSIWKYRSAEAQDMIDGRYYAQVKAQVGFEQLVADPALLIDPDSVIGLFSDHGVVHRPDVAPHVLDKVQHDKGQ